MVSARNASTSSGVGGRPIRSRVSRRISVVRSAGGDGARPSVSSRASTNRSIGFLTQAASRTGGAAGRRTGSNAQCLLHCAPWSIHFFRSSI